MEGKYGQRRANRTPDQAKHEIGDANDNHADENDAYLDGVG